MSEQVRPVPGMVILEWPKPPEHGVGAMPACLVRIFDAFSGSHPEPQQIMTVTEIEVNATADAIVTARLTMFADEHGNAIYNGEPVMKDGEVVTGTFAFVVAEMRVRQ